MYSPDLIQRIFFEKENGNDSNFKRVFTDFNIKSFDFVFDFDFEDRRIYWTCFESKKYSDIIKEADEYLYFYLWDNTGEFEIVIPAHSEIKDLSKSILKRTPSFHGTIWVIGEYFPGLEEFSVRPVKIREQFIGIGDYREIQTLSYAFRKMLSQFKKKKKAIFEWVDYPNSARGEKGWKRIADKKK